MVAIPFSFVLEILRLAGRTGPKIPTMSYDLHPLARCGPHTSPHPPIYLRPAITTTMSHLTSHHTLPPFAQGLRTAPLVSISLAKLESASPVESETFFDACKNLGFFYLDMNASQLGERMVSEAEELNVLQKEFFELSNAVKEEYGREKLHQFYAYRYEEFAERDVNMRNESYNVSHLRP